MADNLLRPPQIGDPNNPLNAASPTWADAASWNMQNLRDTWAAMQQPQTWVDAARQYGNALMMGTSAPGGSIRLYHGTRESLSKFSPGETYLTDNSAEAMGYAMGGHLGGKGNGAPRVLSVDAKPGKALDANPHINDAMEEGDDVGDAVDAAIKEARSKGYRYVTYQHPSFSGADDQSVTVSLYPHQDLRILSGDK